MGVRYNKELIPKDRRITNRGPRDLQQRHNAATPAASSDVEDLKERIVALSSTLEQRSSSTEGLYTADQVNAEILKAINAETNQLKLEHERLLNEATVKIINLDNEVNSLKEKLSTAAQQLSTVKQAAESDATKYANDVKSKYDDLLENRDLKIKSLIDTHKAELASLTSRIKAQDELIANLRETKNTGISEDKLDAILIALAKDGATAADIPSSRPKMETSFIDPLGERDDLEYKIEVADVSFSRKEAMSDKVNKLKCLMGKLPAKRLV